MNRQQMIEKVAHHIGKFLPTVRPIVLSEMARSVVEAILPQVTTVEELEALPTDTVVVAPNGCVYERFLPYGWLMPGEDDEYDSLTVWLTGHPLTVVWSPS